MPALAATHSLSYYTKLSISTYRAQLMQAGKANRIDLHYKYCTQYYSYTIKLTLQLYYSANKDSVQLQQLPLLVTMFIT